jgi:hypothetical protein
MQVRKLDHVDGLPLAVNVRRLHDNQPARSKMFADELEQAGEIEEVFYNMK